jgi:hypothetical protein
MVCTIKEYRYKNGIAKVRADWTSDDAAGTATGTTKMKYTGEIVRLTTIPGGAPNAPTDNYDITVHDEDGTDVLMGAGADRDTANTEQVLGTSLGVVFDSTLEFNVASAGNAKTGTIIIHLRVPWIC